MTAIDIPLISDKGIAVGIKELQSSAMNAVKEEEKSILFKYLDTAASIFLVINPDHSVELVNRKGCEILEYDRDQIKGKNWFRNFIPEKDRTELTQLFDDILNEKVDAPEFYENWILARGHKPKLIQWRTSLLKNGRGKVLGLISSGVDITELAQGKKKLEHYSKDLEQKVKNRTRELQSTIQKLVETNVNLEAQILATEKAEVKYRESQVLINAIAENFPKGAIVVFNRDCEVIYIEGEELKHFGLDKSKIMGSCVDDLEFLPEEQKRKTKSAIRLTLRGTSISDELEFQGQIYTVNSTPLYSKRDKEIASALLVYYNVTEQKHLQQQLENALMSERHLNEMKSRFISMASHEFRTPLSVILSSAILIGRLNEPGKEDRRIKHVERIRSNVNNLVVILNDFLSLDKLAEGKIKAVPSEFELIQFSKMVLKEIEPTKKLGQVIHFEHSVAEIPVYLDPKLISHIFMNLLSNAIKYSDEGQPIYFEISRNEKEAVISIRDKGIGIPEEDQKHLFERFFRAANSMNIQGTGLGLHIVKQYLTIMGGEINCVSTLGKGSTFTLKLPLISK